MSHGVLCRVAEELKGLLEAEKSQGAALVWGLDGFIKADTLEGKRAAIATEYILRILGLDVRPLVDDYLQTGFLDDFSVTSLPSGSSSSAACAWS